MSATMRAVVFHGPRDIRLERVPLPEPGPGEVVVRIGAALTCGTDFKAYRQGHRVLLGDAPAPFGHEMAGTVAFVGDGVPGLRPGARVVVANSAPCAGCFYCDRGQTQLCERLKLHNGAYAEYNLVPGHIVAGNLHPIADGLPFASAALAEPLACALHAVDALSVSAGETVAVIGAGVMSLLLLQSLRARGARAVVVGRDRGRLEAALAAGAEAAVSALDGDPVAAVRRWTLGRGADCAIEAVGKAETWRSAVEMARKGGKVCLFGGCAAGTEVSLDAHRIHYSQLTLYGVFHHTPRYFAEALRLLASGRVDPGLLVAGELPLDEVPAYFERAHGRSNLKVAVLP